MERHLTKQGGVILSLQDDRKLCDSPTLHAEMFHIAVGFVLRVHLGTSPLKVHDTEDTHAKKVATSFNDVRFYAVSFLTT